MKIPHFQGIENNVWKQARKDIQKRCKYTQVQIT